jgi:hypothetical protein
LWESYCEVEKMRFVGKFEEFCEFVENVKKIGNMVKNRGIREFVEKMVEFKNL